MTTDATSSHVKHYRPYFTPEEVEKLSAKQRGKLSVSREERSRQQACMFIDAVGARCGFPRRTIATAQTLYMRFHLFFPYKEFNYIEVSLTVLYVASKLHDTLKKPQDIILASYGLRFPHLVKKGHVDPSSVDQNVLKGERGRVMNIERLVLETMCFKFGVQLGLGLVIKLGKAMGVGKGLCQSAWKVAIDCHRTQAPLSFPPHIVALGAIYTASMLNMQSALLSDKQPEDEALKSAHRLAQTLGDSGPWQQDYSATVDQVDDIAHALLDLYILVLSTPPNDPSVLSTPSPVSPKEPLLASTSGSGANSTFSTAYKLPVYWTAQTLTELKIHLRNKRPGSKSVTLSGWHGEESNGEMDDAAEGMGRNDATVRFLWERQATPAGAVL